MNMGRPLLVTGFDAFGPLARNPSEVLLHHLEEQYRGRIQTAVLRTSYAEAAMSVRRLVGSDCPSGLLMFGYGASVARGLRVERLARNASTTQAPDNDGARATGPIIDGGPAAYRATVDVETLVRRLEESRVPTTLSDDAGGYVCNHAYFIALHQLHQRGCKTPCVFVHVANPKRESDWHELETGAQLIIETLLGAVQQPGGAHPKDES